MSAIVAFYSTIKDSESFLQYATSVPETLPPFQGRLLKRGRVEGVLSGDHPHQNLGILEFPDVAAARSWYESDAYQLLIPTRDKGAEMTAVLYEEPS